MSSEPDPYSQAYQDTLKKFRQRHDEFEVLKPILKEVAANEIFAKDCETALSVGTGYGQYDIEFFQYFTNLKKLIIVDKDHDSLEELIPNLKNCFGDKVEFEIYEMSIEEFMKDEVSEKLLNKLDIVASFHSLLFLSSVDRREFFRLCFDFWLKPSKGKLVVLNPSKDNVMYNCHQVLANKMRPFQDTTLIRGELNDISVTFDQIVPYTVRIDMKEYDKDLYFITHYSHKEVVDHEEMERALRKVSHDGYGFMSCELIVASRNSSV